MIDDNLNVHEYNLNYTIGKKENIDGSNNISKDQGYQSSE